MMEKLNRCHRGERFHCRGFRRWTFPRQAILEVLHQATEPLSAEEIFFKVHEHYPQIGLATVYRTLDILTQEGEVLRVELGDRRARFSIVTSKVIQTKIFLVCNRCGAIQVYNAENENEVQTIESFLKQIAQKSNFQLSTNHIQLKGWCKNCKLNENKGEK